MKLRLRPIDRLNVMPYPFKKPSTPKVTKVYSEAELKVWYDRYRSYEDRLKEWRRLDRKVSNGILRKVHHIDGTIKCLSTKCDTVLTTANGMSYHLRMCSLESDERRYRCPMCKEEMYVKEANGHTCKGDVFSEMSTMSRLDLKSHGLVEDSCEDEDLSDEDLNFYLDSTDSEEESDSDGFLANYYKSHPPKRIKRSLLKRAGTSKEKVKQRRNIFSVNLQDMQFCESAFPTMQCRLEEWRNFSMTHPNLHSSFYKSSVFMRYDNIQQFRRLKRLESVNTWAGAIGFTGSRISACVWCPSKTDIQYILVSLYVGSFDGLYAGPHQSILQLWAFDPQAASDSLKLNCIWNLVHKYGMVRCLKWCPSGIYEDKNTVKSDRNLLPRLGCFAASTSCGTVVIYCVPHPECAPVHPVLTLLTNSRRRVISLDWNVYDGHSRIAAGQENGMLSVWDLSELDGKTRVLKPRFIIDAGDWPLLQTFWFTREYVLLLNSNKKVSMWNLQLRELVSHRVLSSVTADHILLHPYLSGLLFAKYNIRTNSTQLMMTMPFTGSDRTAYRRYSTHSDKVWSIAFSPHSVSIVSADNEGTIASSGVDTIEADTEIDVQKTLLVTQVDLLGDNTDRPYIINDLEIKERLKKCALTFSTTRIKGTPTVKVNKCKAQMICGLSIDAIFWVDINYNENMTNWLCAGGESGFLHIISMDGTDSPNNELNIEGSSVEYTSEGDTVVCSLIKWKTVCCAISNIAERSWKDTPGLLCVLIFSVTTTAGNTFQTLLYAQRAITLSKKNGPFFVLI
ncbi:General transcription factor 3C polypeptide [Trichinella spiralis]|uniref:General transcription factor 3C polypeptide n=1 Tax=Trichinella spiralis TaxID=6334 RepID=A0ABR3KU25_TRISP